MAVFTWIEGWYNPRRRHSGLGYLSPLNFERSNEALFDVVEDAVVHVETTPETVLRIKPVPVHRSGSTPTPDG